MTIRLMWCCVVLFATISSISKAFTKGATRVLQGCYNGVTLVLQGCYKGVTRVLQGRVQFLLQLVETLHT
jgi:hypothetical protein